MIFVDTGAWFALSIESDPDHLAAKSFVAANREEFITTDYVVDELLTLFKVRGQKAKGIEWLYDVLEGSGTHLYWVGEECFAEACRLYKEFADKKWRFTDCTSYAAIQLLGIKKAFPFDDDFRQFGIVMKVP